MESVSYRRRRDEDLSLPLTDADSSEAGNGGCIHEEEEEEIRDDDRLPSRIWIETKKLWKIVGPSILNRLATFSTIVITQAFAGHLGDVQFASVAIACTIIVAFNFGLFLGMASALETLCGQAFGAKRFHMLGIYLQRSWIVLFFCGLLILPIYIFAAPILKLLGQADDVAEMTGVVALYLIPLNFSFAFQFPLQRFLQCQLKNAILAWVSLAGLILNIFCCWLFINVLNFGVLGAALSLDISWWFFGLGYYFYTVCGCCPLTWHGFSFEAFSGLWEFVKLSVASGFMLCLETWYYRILVLLTGHLKNVTISVDALSVCLNINGCEMMIHIAFLAGIGVRVANELGAGNGKAAKFATQVSVAQSTMIGLFLCIVIVVLRSKIAYIFTTSSEVVEAVNTLSYLLAITILLNSVQPVLSGVAIGSGWQAWVAYINLFCYYVIGVPLGFLMGWVFHFGVECSFVLLGIWGGMILGGTGIQTVILAIITLRTNWENEVEKARTRVKKWSTPVPDDGEEGQH